MFDLLIYNAKIITMGSEGIIKNGYILINDGKVIEVKEGDEPENINVKEEINAEGRIVMPSLVDCHTHLMEYATGEIHKTRGKAQKMSGISNLLTALKYGITAVGEHHLGHPVLNQTTTQYFEAVKDLPVDVKLAVGCCFLGTDPLAVVSATSPGSSIKKEELTKKVIRQMAKLSQFPGESIFLNATVANLPLSAAPRAGEITYTFDELKNIVDIFHSEGKGIGAHIEGDTAAMMFIRAKGDIIHHGHGISLNTAETMAKEDIPLVVTPHGGTSRRPTSPEKVYKFYELGVKIALASDSYLPVHPEAAWIDWPEAELVGPEGFMKICKPVVDYLIQKGKSIQEALKLITLNGREILNLDQGCVNKGCCADLILCEKIPVIETTDPLDIKYVIKDGKIVIDRTN